MKLSEYGLFTVRKGTDGKLVEEPLPGMHTEQAIFEALGMAYKAPAERDL
jgi:DNA polymerase/3'-5' exonuclease PolX